MSGYGGGPPGWGAPPGYGPPGYGPPGYGPPGVPPGQGSNGSAIAALICACVATSTCCNVLAIPAIVTSVIALNRYRVDPAGSRSLTIWSWVLFGIAMVVYIGFVVVMGIADSGSDDTY
ncbi:hypothetical protein [Actinomadura macrotermitis]|uniref:DUF4190 domain-containing protein n=1 Tax=Actinomadura macrotermitis TaxID=2585200 RepID=A0A7K0C8Q8_9ACTN|nr:hypothetical protein [Actinomadura macrotermitis]MQY09847.1 hypothetical protein [Actinomadura macrotermitis]